MTPRAHPEPVAGEHCCRAEAASLVYVEGLIPAQVFAQDLQSPPFSLAPSGRHLCCPFSIHPRAFYRVSSSSSAVARV